MGGAQAHEKLHTALRVLVTVPQEARPGVASSIGSCPPRQRGVAEGRITRRYPCCVTRRIASVPSPLGRARRLAAGISTTLPDTPFTVPVPHLTAESAASEGRDDESALIEGGIGPGVAVAAQGSQAVAIEVRAALGTLPDVMHLEAVSGEAAGLAPPAGTDQDLGPDLAPGLTACRGTAEGQRASRQNAAVRGLSDPHAGGEPAGALHRRPSRFCPRGQKLIADTGLTGPRPVHERRVKGDVRQPMRAESCSAKAPWSPRWRWSHQQRSRSA